MNKLKQAKGFTLLEAVVIILIIAILAVVIVPVVIQYTSKGEDVADQTKVRSCSEIIEEYTILEGRKPNSRDEIYEWIKNASPDIQFTTRTEGYYLWYNMETNKVELKQYLDIAFNSDQEVKEASHIVDNYLFLNDDSSLLSMAIKNVEKGEVDSVDALSIDYLVAHARLTKYISEAGNKKIHTVILKDNQGNEIETLKVNDKAKAEPTINVLKTEDEYKYYIITNWISETEGISDLTSITKDCSFKADAIEITIEIYNDNDVITVDAYLTNGELIEDVRFETENNLVKVYVYGYFIDSLTNN